MFDSYKLRKIPIDLDNKLYISNHNNKVNFDNFYMNLKDKKGLNVWYKYLICYPISVIIVIRKIIGRIAGTSWRLFITYLCALTVLNPMTTFLLCLIKYIPATPINFIDSNNSVMKYIGKYLKISFIYKILFRLSQGRVYSGNYFAGVFRRFVTIGFDPWMMDSIFNNDCLQLVCNNGKIMKKELDTTPNKSKIVNMFNTVMNSLHVSYYVRLFLISCVVFIITMLFNVANGNSYMFGLIKGFNNNGYIGLIIYPLVFFLIMIFLIYTMIYGNNKYINSKIRKLLLVSKNNPIGLFFENFNKYLVLIKIAKRLRLKILMKMKIY